MRKDTTKAKPRKVELSAFAKIIRKKFVVVKKLPGSYRVELTIGNQSFPVGMAHDHRYEAEWYASMLTKAIEKLITTEGDW